MTNILEELILMSRIEGFNQIKFESVISDAMIGFCKKNKFYKINHNSIFDNSPYGDYVLNLD